MHSNSWRPSPCNACRAAVVLTSDVLPLQSRQWGDAWFFPRTTLLQFSDHKWNFLEESIRDPCPSAHATGRIQRCFGSTRRWHTPMPHGRQVPLDGWEFVWSYSQGQFGLSELLFIHLTLQSDRDGELLQLYKIRSRMPRVVMVVPCKLIAI